MKKFTGKLLIAGFASLLFVTPVLAEPSSEELKEDKKKVPTEVNAKIRGRMYGRRTINR